MPRFDPSTKTENEQVEGSAVRVGLQAGVTIALFEMNFEATMSDAAEAMRQDPIACASIIEH